MIRKQSLKKLYESKVKSIGRGGFVKWISHSIGLTDAHGNPYRNHAGNPCIRNPLENGREVDRLRPEEFSFKELAEAIVGDGDLEQKFNTGKLQRAQLYEASHPIMEAGTGALAASQFADINAFTATVAGLLEIKVLEGYELPEFIADKLMPTETTRMMEGRKVIGTTRIGNKAEERLPGMPTARVNIGERWITQPRVIENALSVEVTQEAVFFDLTGEVLQNAMDLGTWLGYNKELRCIDAFIGVSTAAQYMYKGTTYAPYISGGYYDNTFSNELLHWQQVENVMLKFRDMKDPETNTRILTNPNKILVNMEKFITAQTILGPLAEGAEYRDAPGSTSNPQNINKFKSPYTGKFEILTSPLVFQRCTDATGLNISATNAGKYWWMWQQGKPIKYVQMLPLRIQQAAPNQLDMIDRGIVLFAKADEKGTPMYYDPRFVVRSTN